MLLRDYLNEFELDWAQAPVRSELIPKAALKGAKILLIGEQAELQKAIAWSFFAWNDSDRSGVRVQSASLENGVLKTEIAGAEHEMFRPEEADYVILTGFAVGRQTLMQRRQFPI